MPNVFMPETVKTDWAIAEDMRLLRDCLAPLVTFTSSAAEANVIHAGWWMSLLEIPPAALNGKRVFVNVQTEPRQAWLQPYHYKVLARTSGWLVRSEQARRQINGMLGNPPTAMIPFIVDEDVFKPLPKDDAQLQALRAQYSIPANAYLIGNFNRDSEGDTLLRPKLRKGPDLFVETVRLLRQRGYPVHVVIGGPRRHWLRRELQQARIPYTYLGIETEADDLETNFCSHEALSLRYNLIDLSLVTSRTEGGPHAILEAAAVRCKQISTPVGVAPDILAPGCLFETPSQAAELIAQDIDKQTLGTALDIHQARVMKTHTKAAVTPVLKQLYERYTDFPVVQIKAPAPMSLPDRLVQGARKALKPFHPFTVGIWNEFVPPPFGGGNQFLIALRKVLKQYGVSVVENRFGLDIDVHLLHALRFDLKHFQRARGRLAMVHRVDGPYTLIRGTNREKDDQVFELNQKYATATIIQSAWNLERIVEMGYQPVNPIIIYNASDPEIFHAHGRIPYNPNRKLRIIASSWSDNPRKGGPVYRWLEENLDWSRFEMTFVGRISEPLKRARMIEALPSEQLADVLRQHDVYITASQNDPCSNALIEAMTCGLPAIYLNDGGHPELVQKGGLPFTHQEEILTQLDEISAHYEMYQRLLTPPRMEDVLQKYLSVLQDAAKEV